MKRGRLEAFSDGVIAIIITIMVLGIEAPNGRNFADLYPLVPKFLSYILSFIYIGIYWNNHHHMMQLVDKVNGKILWANLHLLFWLSLVPLATAWLGKSNFSRNSLALYGFFLLMAAIAYAILQRSIIRFQGKESELSKAIGRDTKGNLSPILYLLGIVASWFNVWISGFLFIFVAVMWLIPDKRIERKIS